MATPQPPIAHIALSEIDDPRSFYEEGRYQGYCACCAYYRRPQIVRTWEVHHVLSKAHCRRYGAPLHSPDDALRLCAKSPLACHERHTSHQQLLPLDCLRDENVAFVARWLGVEHAYEHLHRYYAGSATRVDDLLRRA